MESQKDSINETRKLIEQLLEDEHCLLHLDPKCKGMVLPETLTKDISVTLKLSHHFAGSVILRDTQIEAELRFGTTPFVCMIPYAGIWAVSSILGVNTCWADRSPNPALPILLEASTSGQLETAGESSGPKQNEAGTKEKPSFLRRVK